MANYDVVVHTADEDGAGTDADVFIRLFGANRRHSREYQLDDPNRNDFEQGNRDHFVLRKVPDDLGDVRAITIRQDNTGLYAAWGLDSVWVRPPGGRWKEFPVHDTLEGGVGDNCVGWLVRSGGSKHCVSHSSKASRSRWDQFEDFWQDAASVLEDAVEALAD
jgi:hypothetical protein